MDNPDPSAISNGSMSVTEVTGLVQLFNNQLIAMEGRLVAKMDDNSRMASERWVKHDHDAERILIDIEERFQKMQVEFQKEIKAVADGLKEHVDIANAHWSKEHDDEVRLNARLTPVKGLLAYVQRNWKTILLVMMSLLAVIGFSSETIRHFAEALGL